MWLSSCTSTASMSYGSDFKITRSDYERRSHFQEWLTNFQAKETLVVSDKVVNAVMEWLYRNGNTDPNNVTLTLVRKALQDLSLPAMYKHVTQITCRITGKEPPRLTPDEEETLKTMFNLLQTPFQRQLTVFMLQLNCTALNRLAKLVVFPLDLLRCKCFPFLNAGIGERTMLLANFPFPVDLSHQRRESNL